MPLLIGAIVTFMLMRAFFKSPRKFMKEAGDDPAYQAMAFFWGVLSVGLVGLILVSFIYMFDPWASMVFFWIPMGVFIFGFIGCLIMAVILQGRNNS